MADNHRAMHAMKALAAAALAAYGFKKGGLVGTALGVVGAGLGATEMAAMAGLPLAESAPLMLTPGRQCENGKPVPVNDPDWIKFSQELADAGKIKKMARAWIEWGKARGHIS